MDTRGDMRILVVNPNTTASMIAKIAATRLVEALVGLGLRTSKVGGGPAAPRPKAYAGDFARFAPGTGG